MLCRRSLLPLALLLGLPLAARAATLMVSPQGTDGAAGTAAAPLAHLQEALTRAQAGDVVHLRPGLYCERVAFAHSGAYGRPVVLEGEPGAILDGRKEFTPDWQPAPDVAPGAYRTRMDFFPFTITANGKVLTTLDEKRVQPDNPDPVWKWPNLFKQGVPPTGWEGPKALAMYRVQARELLVRFQHDLDPRTMVFTFSPREPAVLISGLDRCVVRNLTIQNAAVGVQIESSLGSVVEGCTIRQTDFDVVLGNGSDRCTVRGNDLSLDPYSGADPKLPGAWQNWLAHKTGGFHDRQGVQIQATIGGHEIHDNFIHDQWDGIQTIGGPGENVGVNVHHNRISNLADDGLEPNGAEENCQWHDNLVEKCICGFRIKAPQIGPLYCYRNLFFGNSEDYRNFNAGVHDGKPATVYVYHNTSTCNYAITNNKVDPPGTPDYHYLNNLFYCKLWHSGSGQATPNWQGDYNVYVERDPKFNFEKERPRAAGFGLDLHSQWLVGVEPGFRDFSAQDVSLTAASPARGQGADLAKLLGRQLPGLEPGYYSGAAPDAGALQFGQTMPAYPRPAPDALEPAAGLWPPADARSPRAAPGPNLLTNGGFERGFADWGPALPIYQLKTEGAPEGQTYLAMNVTGDRDDLTRVVGGLTAGCAYTLEYLSRGNTFGDLRIIIRDPATSAYLAVGSGATAGYWRRQVLYFKARGPEVKLHVSPRTNGRCDLDDFVLRARP